MEPLHGIAAIVPVSLEVDDDLVHFRPDYIAGWALRRERDSQRTEPPRNCSYASGGQAGRELRRKTISNGRFSRSGDAGMQSGNALIRDEVRAIERARFARLPWPLRVIGAVLDFVLRRPSPGEVQNS
jgi:hypothetical protein